MTEPRTQKSSAADNEEDNETNSPNDTQTVNDAAPTQCTAKGKKLKSDVWENMTRKVMPDKSVKAICNHCNSSFTGTASNGTSHLKRHLASCARRKYHDMKNYCITSSPSLSIPSESGNIVVNPITISSPIPSPEAIREALGVFFISTNQSFLLAESPGFRNLISVLAPHFSQLSRVTVQRDTMSSYKAQKVIVAQELHDAPGRICLTTDNWRSEHQTDEFMCITAHWIDKNWKLQKRIIKFAALLPPLDGVSLADEISLCLGGWKISEKVFCITLDNASYNDTMVAALRGHLVRKNSLVLNGEFFHLRCACHIINLIVHAGLKAIDEVVLKIRRVINHLKHSMPKNKKFYEIASTSFGLDIKNKLRLDTPTRWNSTFIMLDHYVYFRDAIDSFVGKDSDLRSCRLSTEEWEKVEQLRKFLQVFYDVTNEFSASKTPTSNLYFHGVWKIHKLLTKTSKGPTTIISPMVIEMHAKFEKYWDEYSLILSCAAVLDPRMKLVGVEFLYKKLFGEVYAHEMADKIKSVLVDLLDEYKLAQGEHVSYVGEQHVGINSRLTAEYDSGSDGETLDDFMSKKLKTEISSELDLYLNEKPSHLSKSDFNILQFWKRAESRFVVLSTLARDILSIPISTVPSESAFSMGKKIISCTRSSLASSTVEALACLEDWLRARGFEPGPSSVFKIGKAPRIEVNDEE